MTDKLDPVRDRIAAAEDIKLDDVPHRDDCLDGDDDDPGPRPDDSGRFGEPPADDDTLPPAARASFYPLNDIGNGQRLVTYFGDKLMRVPRVGWFWWTGTHWARDDDELTMREMAQKVSGLMEVEMEHISLTPAQQGLVDQLTTLKDRYDQINAVPPSERSADQKKQSLETAALLDQIADIRAKLEARKSAHWKFAKSTGNSAKIKAMLEEGGIALSRTLDSLDADPLAINCESGTIRFRVGKREGEAGVVTMSHDPHNRDDRNSKCMPCRYDPSAETPKFDAFLERIQPKASMRQFIQRWFGLSMSGIPVQRLAFFYGHGANGKSVLVDLMCRMLADYAATAPIEALTGQSRRGGSDATPELMPLIGARAVRSSEPEEGERFKEGMIKSLTSGEPIPVRALNKDFVFITTFFKLTISGNHRPEIRGTDDGIWRRVLLVPFDVQIPEAERNPDLINELWQERDGILNWMLQGLDDYLKHGLQVPEEVSSATDSYRKDSDPTGAFLTDATIVTGNGNDFLLAKDLVNAMRFWLVEEGQTPWGERTCSLRIKEKAERWRHPDTQIAFTPHRRGSTGYLGIRFKDTFAAALRNKQSGSGGTYPPLAPLPADMQDF